MEYITFKFAKIKNNKYIYKYDKSNYHCKIMTTIKKYFEILLNKYKIVILTAYKDEKKELIDIEKQYNL